MICKICKKEFIKKHFNQKYCSPECKYKAKRISQDKYKKTEKGKQSYLRWSKSLFKKRIDIKYRKTEKAKKVAVIRTKRFLEKHPEYKEKNKIYYQRWAEKIGNKKCQEIVNRAGRKYGKTEKGKIARKNGKAKRRSYLEYAGKFTLQEWEDKLKEFNYKCAFCGQKGKLESDHIIPISKGGENTINNIQPLCRSCNAKKNSKIL